MVSTRWVKAGLLAVSLLVIIIDQWTKKAAEISLSFGQVVAVFPSFNFQLSYNTGAAFGMLGDAGGWQRILFSLIAVAIIASIVFWIIRQHKERVITSLGLAVILGGAAGNLIDRVAYGHVIDFVLLSWEGNSFPNFNIADVAINLGALMVLIGAGGRPKPIAAC